MDKWTGAVLRRSGEMRDRVTGVRLQRLELSQQNYESIGLQRGKIKRSLNVSSVKEYCTQDAFLQRKKSHEWAEAFCGKIL
jgi:hypothetical protein